MTLLPEDRAWFARHPDRIYRLRPPRPDEMHGLVPVDGDVPLRLIRNRAPRVATTVIVTGTPDDTDAQAADLMWCAAALMGGLTKQ